MCRVRDGFLGENVESRSGEDVFFQTPLHGVQVHDLAPGGVDQDGAPGQEAEQVVADHPPGLAGAGAVDAQRGRPAEEFPDVLGPLDVEGLVGAVGLVRVIEQDLPAEGFGPEGGRRPDPPQTQHAEGGPLDAFDERGLDVGPRGWGWSPLVVVVKQDASPE